MKKYRTTIIIPESIYRKTRILAAAQNKSFSKYIAEVLQDETGGPKTRKGSLPLGKYTFREAGRLHRKDIYEAHTKRKLSS